MNFLQLIAKTLLELVQAITYKWILALIKLIKSLIGLIREFCREQKLPHDQKNATNTGCGVIDHPSFHRADPLIYSQKYLLSLGLAVTWDNPDIILLKNGVQVPEYDLLPNTEYEIDATIWNNSFEAPVVGMPVHFSFLSFGASTITNPIGSTVVNVGVKGGPNHPAHARIKWVTPPAGHYCLQAEFVWDDDVNPNNNFGQNNVDVRSPQSPAVFHFDLRNTGKKPDVFHFEIDTYKIPAPPVCEVKINKDKTIEEKWKEIKAIHNKNNFPVPPGWTIVITPETVTLQPDETADIEVKIEPPPNFLGEQTFNINALSRTGKYAGGVTLTVSKQ